MPGEAWVLLMVLISLSHIIVRNGRLIFPKCDCKTLLSLLMILFLTFGNAMISGEATNAVFYVIYIALIFFIAITFKNIVGEKNILKTSIRLCWIEIILIIIEILQYKRIVPGDNYYGSFKDAHEFGIWLLFMITYLLYCFRANVWKKRFFSIITIAFLLIALYLSDSKHVVAAYAMAAILYKILKILKIKYHMVDSIVLVPIIAVYIGIFSIQVPLVKSFIEDKAGQYSIYLYDTDYNFKYQYYYGTLKEELRNLRFFVGFGLGEYGSRGANLFAYDIMYRNNNALNNFIANHFPAKCIENYRKYASFYTSDLVNEIRWRSAVLTYPFNSLIAFVAENGLIGIICWLMILRKLFEKSSTKFHLCFFIIVCMFDLYIDRINVVGTMIMLMLAHRAVQKESTNEKNSIYNSFIASRRG